MSKSGKDRPEFSRDREFKVILEDIQSQFRAFGEGLQNVNHRLDRMEKDISQIKEDVSRLKIDVKQLQVDVGQLKVDVGQLQIQMSFVHKVLPTVATKDDLRFIEKRMLVLESAR